MAIGVKAVLTRGVLLDLARLLGSARGADSFGASLPREWGLLTEASGTAALTEAFLPTGTEDGSGVGGRREVRSMAGGVGGGSSRDSRKSKLRQCRLLKCWGWVSEDEVIEVSHRLMGWQKAEREGLTEATLMS